MPPRERWVRCCGSTATRTCVAYERPDSTSTLSIPAGSNLHRRMPRTRNSTSVRARGLYVSAWPARSLAADRDVLAQVARYPPLPSSTSMPPPSSLPTLVLAFGLACRSRPSACSGEISPADGINGELRRLRARVKPKIVLCSSAGERYQMSFSEDDCTQLDWA